MTLWNWLSLILAPLAIMGGLNAFFGLRSRYQDWRGTRSNIAFKKRLRQLSEELNVIERFTDDINLFLKWALDAAITPLRSFGLAFMLLLFAFVLPIEIFRSPIGLIALLVTMSGVGAASHMFRVIRFVNTPDLFVDEVIAFLYEASRRRLTLDEGDDFAARFSRSGLVTNQKKELMVTLLSDKYPNVDFGPNRIPPTAGNI